MQPAQRRQDFVMELEDWQIETAIVLGHRQVDVILVHVRPFERQCLGLPEPGEQKHFIVDLVDRVEELLDGPAPELEILDDRARRAFLIPLNGHCRGLWQVVGASSMVPDRPEILERVVGTGRHLRHRPMSVDHHALGDLIHGQA